MIAVALLIFVCVIRFNGSVHHVSTYRSVVGTLGMITDIQRHGGMISHKFSSQ